MLVHQSSSSLPLEEGSQSHVRCRAAAPKGSNIGSVPPVSISRLDCTRSRFGRIRSRIASGGSRAVGPGSSRTTASRSRW